MSSNVKETENGLNQGDSGSATGRGGRKTYYRPELAKRVERLAAKGFTDEELAKELDVATGTISNWKKKHKKFSAAIERGKQLHITELNHLARKSMKKLLSGYQATETTIEPVLLTRTKGGGLEADEGADEKDIVKSMVVVKKVKKRVGPNASAVKTQLERCDVQYKPKGGIDVTVDGLTRLLEQIDGSGKQLPSED